jgi:hypothetical protein
MEPLTNIYKGRFFNKRNRLYWRAEPVCKAINTALEPKSVMDVGCAIGDYVHYWKNFIGITAYGIEGSKNAEEYFMTDGIYIRDLREPLQLDLRVDLVTCFEVAEHIEPEYSHQFRLNLTQLSDQILMSAASPGQGGHYHVNCRPAEYWKDNFSDLGYDYNEEPITLIRALWEPWRKKKEMSSYYHNLFYFERRN